MMYILNQSETVIYNSEFFANFFPLLYSDAILISARHGEEKPVTLGKYHDMEEARGVIRSLFDALRSDLTWFEMPLSEAVAPEPHIKDARIRRKGGS